MSGYFAASRGLPEVSPNAPYPFSRTTVVILMICKEFGCPAMLITLFPPPPPLLRRRLHAHASRTNALVSSGRFFFPFPRFGLSAPRPPPKNLLIKDLRRQTFSKLTLPSAAVPRTLSVLRARPLCEHPTSSKRPDDRRIRNPTAQIPEDKDFSQLLGLRGYPLTSLRDSRGTGGLVYYAGFSPPLSSSMSCFPFFPSFPLFFWKGIFLGNKLVENI